ncbi:MAG: LysR family transcriptional regulator [Spirochaetaceae bacterium]|jgi:molybdate transport repressor ModE-like protein|nr:LysR family transcriptional regulator [Spirochaetaceae bacterium]
MEIIKPVAKVFLTTNVEKHGEPFCGPGVIQLLDAIAASGNVRKACAEIGLSYSKAWKLLRVAEECAGFPLIERRQGGSHGGSASVTEKGAAFSRAYHEFADRSQSAAEQIFRELFASFL